MSSAAFSASLSASMAASGAPAPAANDPNWRSKLDAGHRQKLVLKLIEALSSCVSQQDLREKEQNIRDLAEKIEGTVFAEAPRVEEYYHLLAEKIYKLKKAQEARRVPEPVSGRGLVPATAVPGQRGPRRFPREELQHHFGPLLDRIGRLPDAGPFLVPVDPVALGIPVRAFLSPSPLSLS